MKQESTIPWYVPWCIGTIIGLFVLLYMEYACDKTKALEDAAKQQRPIKKEVSRE